MSKDYLRDKMAQVQAALQDIPGVQLHDIRNFLEGQLSITRKGQLKLPLALPANEVLPPEADVGAVVRGEWTVLPLLLFIADEEATAAATADGSNSETG
jgi:hypothetical protein